jgi:hypothetical protein
MKTMATQETLQSLLERLNALTPAATRRWGKMTPHETICHLTDCFNLSLGEKSASPATGFFQRTFLKWGALWVPIQWPRGFKTRPEIEQGKGGTPPVEYSRDRDLLVTVIRRFAATRDFGQNPHPFFGAMADAEWKRWGFLHTDHHLRQFGV